MQQAALACDLLFGPSYKGVPLAVATAIALYVLMVVVTVGHLPFATMTLVETP